MATTMYSEGQPILLHECEFTPAEFADIMSREETNVIFTKLSSNRQQVVKNSRAVQRDLTRKNSVPIVESAVDNAAKSKTPQEQLVNLFVVKREVDPDLPPASSTKEAKNSSGTTSALCSNCGKNFFSNYNLKRHMSSCKLCPEFEKGPRYQCSCGRSYSQEWDMKKHKASCQDNRSKCKSCLYPDCHLLFYHRSQLVTHMKKDHGVSIQDPEVLEFDTLESFRSWKEREEEETYTYYSKQTGSNVTGVSVNTYYVCQHDGSDRTHGSTPRKTERRNKKGRVKTGRLCWSQMNVKEFQDGSVRVTYFPSHTHPISAADTEHHPLPKSISSEIKRRLSDIKNDSEDVLTSDYPEFKKSRKKSYGMNLRTLRALARKNRKLFRITAEAMEGADDVKMAEQADNSVADTSMQEEKHTVLLVPAEELKPQPPTREQIIESCSSSWNQLKTLMESGNLSDSLLSQVQSTLCALVENCHDRVLHEEESGRPSLCELTEVLYHPDSNLSPNSFSMSETGHSHLSSKQPEETVYQVVTLGAKDNASRSESKDMLYQNTVELVSPREFIIIANDHAQIFQTVDPVQLNLS